MRCVVTRPDPKLNPYATSGYAQEARTRKAIALETALRLGGFDSELAAELTADQRRQVEKAAGTRPASDTTWDLVLTFMRDAEGRAKVPEHCVFCRAGGHPLKPTGHEGPCDPKEEPVVPSPAAPRRPAPGYIT